MNNYDVRDISLAPSGHRKIEWVKNNMPLLSALEEDFKRDRPFEGLKISLSVHLEATACRLRMTLLQRLQTGDCRSLHITERQTKNT